MNKKPIKLLNDPRKYRNRASLCGGSSNETQVKVRVFTEAEQKERLDRATIDAHGYIQFFDGR